jgi:photosystem II stability/assembly factor-like uncharacterized protein
MSILRKNILILALLLLMRFTNSQWVQQYSGSNYTLFKDVFFINSNTGYVIGLDTSMMNYTFIFKTTNNGLNWNNISIVPNIAANSIYFTSELTGYSVGYGGKIFKTTNGGINWGQQYNGPENVLTQVEFIGIDTGYVVGDVGTFLKTTNGGNLWTKFQHYIGFRFTCLDFIDANTGYFAGEYDASSPIIKTTNGGINWYRRFFLPINFTGISFCNALTGYAVGWDGIVYKTTNGGENYLDWVLCGFLSALYDVKTFNKDTAIVVGNRYIRRTVNGGFSWETQYYNTEQVFEALYFVNNDTGYSVGSANSGGLYHGIILKTTNGGVPIGIVPISNEIPDNYQLFQNYPNPFNPKTNIKFDISKKSNVQILIYDILGKEIEILVNKEMNGGTYEVNWDASSYPSGVYIYKLVTNDFTETKKMVLIK